MADRRYALLGHTHAASSVAALDDVGDVTITAIASGELLKWNGSAWINNTLAEAGVAAASHTHVASDVTDFSTAADARIAAASVNDLTDVTVTTPSIGQVLKWNGSAWVNDTDATGAGSGTLDDLTDVTITAAATGDILRYNGSAWVDYPDSNYAASGHNHSLDSLSNVTITANSSGELLKWNGSAWVNNTLAEAGVAAASHDHTTIEFGTTDSTLSRLSAGILGVEGKAIMSHNGSYTSGQIFFSTSDPTTEGNNGDVWFKYTA